jgi:hypothetical protein
VTLDPAEIANALSRIEYVGSLKALSNRGTQLPDGSFYAGMKDFSKGNAPTL